MEKEDSDQNLESLYKWRLFVDKERVKTAHYLDKYLITFSTGILALSVSFTLTFDGELSIKYILALGWIMLILSVISTLLSIYFSEKAFGREIEITDYDINSIFKKNSLDNKRTKNYWNEAVDFFTIFSIGSFIEGIVLLSYFYFNNL